MPEPADFEKNWRDYPCVLSSRTPSLIYPHRRYCGRNKMESHVVFFKLFGYWPKAFACHRCDVPRCIEPRRLFDGTPAENSADCVKKGRISKGLEASKVRKGAGLRDRIIDLYKAGVQQISIAEYLGIRSEMVWNVTYKYRKWTRASTSA